MFSKVLKFQKIIFAMEYSTHKLQMKNNYEECIKTLNGLISNMTIITKSAEQGSDIRLQHIAKTQSFCERAGISMSQINQLKVIHVAGTKGKGSTCNYIESILRHHGYKTGLFTSPHLKEVRERIGINGVPISTDDFSDSFWPVYEKLSQTMAHKHDMPFYFQFLTVLAFDIFLKKQVDFVILETGIGGRFDSTNIVARPEIACITSLGYDHMEILGSTMSEISWNKAGIIKPKSIVFTCDSQPTEALEVIGKEVEITDSKLYLVPTAGKEMLNITDNKTSIHSENSFLASAICQMLLDSNFASMVNDCSTLNSIVRVPLDICMKEEYQRIIYSTPIAGRYQQISKLPIEYYIDGAHTVESIKTSVEWFSKVVENQKYDKRYLVFMITGNRSAENLLSQLTSLDFDGILLSPLVPYSNRQHYDFALDDAIITREKAKLAEISATWTRLNLLLNKDKKISVEYFDCFADIDKWLVKSGKSTQVLVVGSLHLVGCALCVLS